MALALAPACHRARPAQPSAKATPKQPAVPPPAWLTGMDVQEGKLCGIGVAGKAWNNNTRYPQELAARRALENLAGVLGTSVEEAFVDRTTEIGTGIETARVLTVDEDLITKVADLAETTFWLDADGTGPFTQAGFTYALSCLEAAKAAAALAISPQSIRPQGKLEGAVGKRVPKWINKTGKQPGNKLCAVGFSQPMFFPEKTFDSVVEDVRGQLAIVVETLVSSYYEELTTARSQAIESMTVANTKAMSEGVVVTHFWYDAKGIGPVKQERSTYGWGCVYPVAALQKNVAAAPKGVKTPPTVGEVRERAAKAFEDLDAEILKRSTGQGAQATGQSATTTSTQ
ncbi:MAG: hypothetical protein AAB426_03455 [Myxococcota bacterium]